MNCMHQNRDDIGVSRPVAMQRECTRRSFNPPTDPMCNIGRWGSAWIRIVYANIICGAWESNA